MKIFLLIALMALSSCYQKYLVLRADAVSMTRKDAGDGKNIEQGEEVSEKWCIGEPPALPDEDENYGLADQVIYKAQQGGKAADFITDVSIYRDSKGCALLSGRLARAK
jgi:hypothetical protein